MHRSFFAGPVEQAVTAKALGWEVPKERRGMAGFGSFGVTVSTLEKALEDRTFICGDRSTAADVYVGRQLNWGLMFGTLPKLPVFEAYCARLSDRGAYKRGRAKDGELIVRLQKPA